MLARSILTLAAAAGLALGTLIGLAWHPAMNRTPLRPWDPAWQPTAAQDLATSDAPPADLGPAMPAIALVSMTMPVAAAAPAERSRRWIRRPFDAEGAPADEPRTRMIDEGDEGIVELSPDDPGDPPSASDDGGPR